MNFAALLPRADNGTYSALPESPFEAKERRRFKSGVAGHFGETNFALTPNYEARDEKMEPRDERAGGNEIFNREKIVGLMNLLVNLSWQAVCGFIHLSAVLTFVTVYMLTL